MDDQRSLRDEVLELLWRTWGVLGVSTWSRDGATTVVDPEALIVLTCAIADTRLRDETIDWGITHAHLLAPNRIRFLARGASQETTVAPWLATVASHAPQVTWRTDAAAILDRFQPSNASRAYDEAGPTHPAIAALRARAVFGTSARGEVIRALHPVARGALGPLSTSQIAARAASSTPGILAVLNELEQAAIVHRRGSHKRRRYEPRLDDDLARAVWRPWTNVQHGPWVEASNTMPILLNAIDLLGGERVTALTLDQVRAMLDHEGASIEQLSGAPLPPLPQGGVTIVGANLLEQLTHITQRSIDRLNQGTVVQRPTALPTADAGLPWNAIKW
jgi:hypothetical protein